MAISKMVKKMINDARHTTRLRAEEWARRAVLAAGLVRAPVAR